MKFFFLLTFVFWVIQSNGQNEFQKNDTLFLFYESGTFNLSTTNKEKLHRFINNSKKNSCLTTQILLNGYSDIDGSEQLNIQLTHKRMSDVKAAIENSSNYTIKTTNCFAEKGIRRLKKNENRRVEVIFYCEPSLATPNETEIKKENSEPKKIKVYKDSIITFPSGMQVILKKELLTKLNTSNTLNNLKIKDQSLINPNVIPSNTQDTNGYPLASAGMFDISFKGSNGKDTCLNTPVNIRFPLSKNKNYNPKTMRPYKRNSKGLWEKTDDFEVKRVKIMGKKYFEITVICSGKFNLDAPVNSLALKLKISRVPKNIILDSVIVTNDFNTIRLKGISSKKNIIKMFLPFKQDRLNVQYYFHNKETLETLVSKRERIKKHQVGFGFHFYSKQNIKDKFPIKFFWPRSKKRAILYEKLMVKQIST